MFYIHNKAEVYTVDDGYAAALRIADQIRSHLVNRINRISAADAAVLASIISARRLDLDVLEEMPLCQDHGHDVYPAIEIMDDISQDLLKWSGI